MYGLNELHRIIAKCGIDAVRKELEIAASLEGGYDEKLVAEMQKLDEAGQVQREIFAQNFEEDFDFGELDRQDQESWNQANADEEAASEALEELEAIAAERRK